MAFAGIEFEDNSIALISTSWFTPRKNHTFWPPYKTQELFQKALRRQEIPCENKWKLFEVTRCFFQCDDFDKAKQKLKLAEDLSDVQSEVEQAREQDILRKRTRKPTKRLYESDDEDEEDEIVKNKTQKTSINKDFPRPPPINNKLFEKITNYSSCGRQTPKSPLSQIEEDSIALSQQVHISPIPEQQLETFQNTPTSRSFLNQNQILAKSAERKKTSVIDLLLEIREQNKQILAHLEKNCVTPVSGIFLPDDFPIDLPCTLQDHLEELENYLSEKTHLKILIGHFSNIGGKEVVPKVNAIMRKCLSNRLATNYSYLGTRLEKKAFANLHLKEAVVGAVKSGTSVDDETLITSAIKEWLKHAPQRVKFENKKKN